MDLSPAEEGLINVIRTSSLGDMSLSVTRASGVFVVMVASPEENGIMMGAGSTLEAAVYSVAGYEAPADPGGGEAAPRPVLRIVGGTTTHAEANEAA